MADKGAAGPSLGGRSTRIGEVFRVTVPGAADRYYLLEGEGLTPLTATAAALVLGDPETREKVYEGRPPQATVLGADALNGRLAPGADEMAQDSDRPEAPPEVVGLDEDTTACVRIATGAEGPRISVALEPAAALGPAAQAPPEGLTPACLPVARITVRPGGGALVRALGAGGSQVGGTLYLVTDTGMKYRVGTAKALAALGYTEGQARGLPSPLLAMLPTGPDLSPEAAAVGEGGTTAPRCETGARISGPVEPPSSRGETAELPQPPNRKGKGDVDHCWINSPVPTLTWTTRIPGGADPWHLQVSSSHRRMPPGTVSPLWSRPSRVSSDAARTSRT